MKIEQSPSSRHPLTMLSTIHLHVLLHHHGFNGGKITQKNNFAPLKAYFTRSTTDFIPPISPSNAPITCLQQFNGVKVVQRYNFDPVKYTFAPYLAYIRQIRETWIHSWVIRPECASGSRSHFLTKPATCSTLFPNRHLPAPIARPRRIHHDAPSLTLPSDALYWPWAR